MATFGKFAKKFKMLQMHKDNYENNPKFANKRVPNAPNTSGVSIILVMEIFMQDMFCKSRRKKVQHLKKKKKLSSKGQA
jgi:hypothetical protein